MTETYPGDPAPIDPQPGGTSWSYPPPPTPPGFGPPFGEPEPEPEPRGSGRSRAVVVAAVTAALVGGGVGAGTVAALDDNGKTTVVNALPQSAQTAPIAAKLDGTVSGAAAKIQPSVVTIDVTGQNEQGNGSGVVIRKDGYIVTNDHVVSVAANGGTMTVVTNDGQQGKATIVGRDPSDDLAVIKVSGLKLTPATFGKSSNLVAGQTVVAVGAPLGLSDTVTSGIVSNIARPVRSGDSDQAVFDAIQTDAAINPGNSGGALADLNGNVVGINAAIATPNTGGLQIPGQQDQSGSIGIGFAIPSDEVSRIAAQLITTGKATHAVIGVQVPGQSRSQSTPGAQLIKVDPNSPAGHAGLRVGDIVTMVNTQRIDNSDALIAAVRSHAPGEKVSLVYTRDGKSKTVEVTLGSASD